MAKNGTIETICLGWRFYDYLLNAHSGRIVYSAKKFHTNRISNKISKVMFHCKYLKHIHHLQYFEQNILQKMDSNWNLDEELVCFW